jgi:putative peptide zinc metalloprotease protein
MLQLTPLLCRLLEEVDGHRTYAEIAERVSATDGRTVTADNVAALVDAKLRPLGLLLKADGSEPQLRKSNPLLGLSMRWSVTDATRTERLTSPFAALFNPLVVLAVVAGFVAVSWWLLFDKGLASATHQAFHQPGLLLLVVGVTAFSAGFHEFGHAAAARRGGSAPGAMGMGFYLFWPAFYTDVTDSYRLGRAGRLRTDLGGLYFNAIVALGVVGVWWATRYDALLLVVATQILQMLRQLTPLVRFDGYHVLADLTGVPDLYHRIGPTLASLLPWRWRDRSASALKPWARLVITAWVLVVVPLLAFTVLMMVLTLPRILATAWVSLVAQADLMGDAWEGGDVVMGLARFVAILTLVLPIAGIFYILTRLLRRLVGGTWRKTAGRPARRALAVITGLAVVSGLLWAWWPNPDTYRPIAAYERGALSDVLPSSGSTQGRVGEEPLAVGQEGGARVALPQGARRPTREEPGLAMVLVPRTPGASGPTEGTNAPDGEVGSGDPSTWVFPFDQPLPPDEGDNQALSVNTTDDTVTYDLAFALVWVDGETPVDNSNEAYALASCDGCAAVAVAFQVVLVVGDADIVIPQNVAASVTYNCVSCLTYALASQLVVTLDGPLSDQGMAQLDAIWADLADFARTISSQPLSELQAGLEDFQDRILDVVENDPSASPGETGPSASDAPSTQPDGTEGTAPTTETDPDPAAPGSSGAEPSEPPIPSSGASPSESPPAPEESPAGSESSAPQPSPAG